MDQEQFKTIQSRLPTLIGQLSNVTTEYSIDRKHIGEAIGYLTFLQDILHKNNNENTLNRN